VVPDSSEAEIDVRVARAEDIPIMQAALEAVVGRVTVPGTSARLEGSFGMPPMVKTPAVSGLVDIARHVASDLGIDLADVATGGMSDANRIADLGRPVVDGLGPIGGLDHSPGEYVELSSIVPRTALLAGLIRETILAGRDRESGA
jgi:glutamate carboxypeptidase